MDVVVDNSAGGDQQFAQEVAQGLRDEGLEVDLREPAGTSKFDTGVHLVSAGIAIRVPVRPDAHRLDLIRRVVRGALLDRPSLRRRTRSVPVQLGEGERVLAWIDIVE